MSIPRITGREAQELLDVCPPWDHVKIAQTVDLDHGPDRAVLAASAHDLAETVVWLYERIREIHNDQRVWADAYRAPVPDDPWSILPERAARAEAHDDCADMLQTLLDDEEARP